MGEEADRQTRHRRKEPCGAIQETAQQSPGRKADRHRRRFCVGAAVSKVRAIARQYQRRRVVLVGQYPGFRLYELPRTRPLRWFRFMLIGPEQTCKFSWNRKRLYRTRDAASLQC